MPSTATSILDGLSTSVAVKAPCRTVATTNITLAGLQTISGYTTEENDRVLVKGQTNPVDNGIYMASTGSWTRAKDADGNRDLVQGTRVIIRSATVDGVEYELTTANPIVIGTTAQTWTLRYGANATYDQTEDEISAGVTPVDYAYPPGNVRRYGADFTGVASSVTAFTNAIAGSKVVHIPAGTYLIDSSVSVTSDHLLYGDGPASRIELSGNNLRAFKVDNASNVEIHSLSFDGNKPSVGWETSNNFDFAVRVGQETTSTQNDGIYLHDLWFKDIGLDGVYISNSKNVRVRDIHSNNCRRWAVVVASQSTDTFATEHVSVKNVFADCTNGTGPTGKEYPLGGVDVEPDSSVNCDFIELDGIHTKNGSVVMSNGAIRYSSVSNVFIEDSRLVLTNGIKVTGDIILKGKCHIEIDGLADSVPTEAFVGNIILLEQKYEDGTIRQEISRENLWPTDYLDAAATNTAAGVSGVTRTREAVEVDGAVVLADKYTYNAAATGSYLAKHQLTGTYQEGDQIVAFIEINRTDSNTVNNQFLYFEFGDIIHRVLPESGVSRFMVANVLGADVVNPTINIGVNGTPDAIPAIVFRKVFVYVNPPIINEQIFRLQPFSVLWGSSTYNPGSLADGAGDTTTVAVTGAALGDFVQAAFSNDLQGITVTAWVSSASTVSVRFQNESGGTLDLASGTLRVRVWKA